MVSRARMLLDLRNIGLVTDDNRTAHANDNIVICPRDTVDLPRVEVTEEALSDQPAPVLLRRPQSRSARGDLACHARDAQGACA